MVAIPDHDALYHRFFGDPAMVAQLLREFVAGPWLDGLDLAGLERVNTRFHADTGERREADLVWRIPRRDGGDAYVMLLLECQAAADPWMALRMLVYAGLLWQRTNSLLWPIQCWRGSSAILGFRRRGRFSWNCWTR